MKYMIIGGGISGLAIANLLNKYTHDVTVWESESRPGGMIKCDIIDGNLFHRTGGHVFNTKRRDVFDWFWKHFKKETEFTKALRNSVVSMPDGKEIPYPIENHAYYFDEKIMKAFIKDLLSIAKTETQIPMNFEEFLQGKFGETLYRLYFQPYNYKVWRRDLTKIPLSWLEGKLPMPTIEEIIYNNINHVEENTFVHSSFYYPLTGGSQFLANRLSQNLDIRYNFKVQKIERHGIKWVINGEEADRIIFCGNAKQLPTLFAGQIDISRFCQPISKLESHGTTSVFCEIEKNPYSWIYMPSRAHAAHRIICTGNFAASNNAAGKMTATIEFTDAISKNDILESLKKIPYSPKYITHNYEKYTYPIQDASTRAIITALKQTLEKDNVYLLGRFAEWEYYNMDVAIGAAIDLANKLK